MSVEMLPHLDAIVDALTDAGHRVHLGAVTEPRPVFPYVLVWAVPGAPSSTSLCGRRDELDELVGVTVADLTPRNVLVTLGQVRSTLSAARLTVTGRHVERLRLAASQGVTEDTQVILPESDAHPFYAVDQWRLVSTPQE